LGGSKKWVLNGFSLPLPSPPLNSAIEGAQATQELIGWQTDDIFRCTTTLACIFAASMTH